MKAHVVRNVSEPQPTSHMILFALMQSPDFKMCHVELRLGTLHPFLRAAQNRVLHRWTDPCKNLTTSPYSN